MNFGEALRLTIAIFDLTQADLSRKSGVSERQISAFKNGRQEVKTDTLSDLVNALPEDARDFYWGLVTGQITPYSKSIAC